MASRMECILCGKETLPKNRVFLKKEDDLSITIKEIMLDSYENEDAFCSFLSEATVCKSGCHSALKKLTKLKRETEELKRSIISRIGSVYQRRLTSVTDVSPKTTHSSSPDYTQGCSLRKHGRRRRLVYDTPVKEALAQPVASLSGSPVDFFVSKKPDGKSRINRISRSLKSVGRSVGRRNRNSIVCHILKDRQMRKLVSIRIGKLIQKELKETCLAKMQSAFKDKSLAALEKFSWNSLLLDLQRTAPILTSVLKNTIVLDSKPNNEIKLVIAAGVLLQAYSERACFIQRAISLLLYSCHSPKQLYTRLQKAGLCLSHRSTLRLVDKMGESHDEDVKEWCRVLTERTFKDNQYQSSHSTAVANNQPLLRTNCITVSSITSPDQQPLQSVLDSSPCDTETESSQTIFTDDISDMHVSPPVLSPASTTASSELPECDTSDCDHNGNTTSSTPQIYPTFKIVGDNVDKSIRPREETSLNHLESLHYFHSYAVLDRCDMSSFNDDPSLCNPEDCDVSAILPSDDDCNRLRENVTILVARVLRKNFTFFQENVRPPHHIPHLFSKEMAQKSTVIPLGVLDKNENKNEDMKSILVHLHQYVPVQSTTERVSDPVTDEELDIFIDRFHYLLFGGDQLTVERATGTKEHHDNEWRGLDRLEGLVPVVEDWHAKVCLLKAIWKMLYKTCSGSNSSTLYQLRNLIKRRTVTVNIKSDPTACEEFFLLVVEAHIICLAMKEFGLTSISDVPTNCIFSKDNFIDVPIARRNEIFTEAISRIIDSNTFLFQVNLESNATAKKSKTRKKEDHVMAYAKEVLSLGLLYMEFCDSIREGDGLRILRCWRYMMLIFKVTRKNKYAVQASTLLLQEKFVFTDRMRQQLLYSRTINVHGRPGMNIPMDLHMEHLNRELKEGMRHLLSNVNETSVIRVGKSLRRLMDMRDNYDKCTNVPKVSGHHTSRSKSKDLWLLVGELNKTQVFTETTGRKHSQFPNFQGNAVSTVDKEVLVEWLKKNLKKLAHWQ